MTKQTERERDLKNLRKLQDEGMASKHLTDDDLETILDNLSEARKSLGKSKCTHSEISKKIQLASFGRNKDLDVLVYDPDSMVRGMVARRGRNQDLDIFANSESIGIRVAVLNKVVARTWICLSMTKMLGFGRLWLIKAEIVISIYWFLIQIHGYG